jgi:hypothetical protein
VVTIAVDLEGVLISNAVSRFPRPGAAAFVTACRLAGDRVVLYTSVRAELARQIIDEMVAERLLPPEPFDAIVHAPGSTKPLIGIADLLFDDAAGVGPGEEDRLIRVPEYNPADDDDRVLFELAANVPQMVAKVLRRKPSP